MTATIPLRVLIADDVSDIAETMAFMLRSEGYSVELAFDGIDAVRLASAFQPDVILLDIGMPKLDGFEAAWRIRRLQGSDVRLIALTCWGRDEDRDRAILAGFDEYLLKPVDLDVLLQKLSASARAPLGRELAAVEKERKWHA